MYLKQVTYTIAKLDRLARKLEKLVKRVDDKEVKGGECSEVVVGLRRRVTVRKM